MNVIFLGPPGAGKGTHAKLLSEKYRVSHISTGELLRWIQNQDPMRLGQRVQRYMKEGKLVPDDIMQDIVYERIHGEKVSRKREEEGFILDGFPRNVTQARFLDKILTRENGSVDVVVYFETSPKTIVQRLTGRRVCRNCGANYHVQNIPPKVQGRCDLCGGELYQREDDGEATVRKRIQVYQRETSPLIDYYQVQGKLKVVSGDLGLEAGQKVLQEIFETK